MNATVICAALAGVSADAVSVEVDLALGLPAFAIVGLPEGAVKESKVRVTAALSNCGYVMPPRKITVNLAPADLKKSGSAFDLAIASLSLRDYDGLRLCSQLRTMDETRTVPLLIIVEDPDTNELVRGLDMGVNDYLVRPIERNELIARVQTQLRWRRYGEQLRQNVQLSLEMAITDP